jgi:hypothetical protein
MPRSSLFASPAARQALTNLASRPTEPWPRREPVLAAIAASATPIVAVLMIELVFTRGTTLTIVLLAVALVVLNAAGIVARRAVSPCPAALAAGRCAERTIENESHDNDG